MAHSQEGLLGRFTGRISGIIIYQAYGKTIMRSMPAGRHPKATGARKLAQERFARVVGLIRAMKPFTDAGYYDVGGHLPAYQKALSENLSRCREAGNPPGLSWFMPSMGQRAGAVLLSPEVHEGKAIVRWEKQQPAALCQPDDRLMLLAVNTTSLQNMILLDAGKRCDQQASIDLPAAAAGEDIAICLAFRKHPLISTKKDPRNVSQGQWIELPLINQ